MKSLWQFIKLTFLRWHYARQYEAAHDQIRFNLRENEQLRSDAGHFETREVRARLALSRISFWKRTGTQPWEVK